MPFHEAAQRCVWIVMVFVGLGVASLSGCMMWMHPAMGEHEGPTKRAEQPTPAVSTPEVGSTGKEDVPPVHASHHGETTAAPTSGQPTGAAEKPPSGEVRAEGPPTSGQQPAHSTEQHGMMGGLGKWGWIGMGVMMIGMMIIMF